MCEGNGGQSKEMPTLCGQSEWGATGCIGVRPAFPAQETEQQRHGVVKALGGHSEELAAGVPGAQGTDRE